MGQIKVEKNAGGIEGLCVIEPTVHGDARGYFMETYNQNDMHEAGLDMVFVQDVPATGAKVEVERYKHGPNFEIGITYKL